MTTHASDGSTARFVQEMRTSTLAFAVALSLAHGGCGPNSAGQPTENTQVWAEELGGLPAALYAVTGNAQGDIWVAGAVPAGAKRPLVLQRRDNAWASVEVPAEHTLRAAFTLPDGTVFLGGEGGTILRARDGQPFERMQTPGTGDEWVFDIWGEADDVLVAVGGSPQHHGQPFVWRLEAGEWRSLELRGMTGMGEGVTQFLAASGPAPWDMNVVGENGAIVHHDGASFALQPSPTRHRLFDVSCSSAGELTAVGGYSRAVVVERAVGSWVDVSPLSAAGPLFGVVRGDNTSYAVGDLGTVLVRGTGRWNLLQPALHRNDSFNAAWVDADGSLWVAGGALLSEPLSDGLVLRYQPDALN